MILCRDQAANDNESVHDSCAFVNLLLLERKDESMIQLYGPNSVRLWATLSFANMEGLCSQSRVPKECLNEASHYQASFYPSAPS